MPDDTARVRKMFKAVTARRSTRRKGQSEHHNVQRLGWLRAAVLGANDGVLSTSSLIIGVSSAHGTHQSILVAGVAGLVAGAMSMAAGEYVSVSSQADSEHADVARERRELREDRPGEVRELAGIYVKRGLDSALALQVAEQLMARDALGAHSRDELGISALTIARPVQAAFSSAASFAVGAVMPLLMALLAPDSLVNLSVALASLLFLGLLGVAGAGIGGASMLKAAIRVMFWGALAMAVTAGIGAAFGPAPETVARLDVFQVDDSGSAIANRNGSSPDGQRVRGFHFNPGLFGQSAH